MSSFHDNDQLWIVIIIRGHQLLVMIYPHKDGTNPQQRNLKLGWGANGKSIIVIIIISGQIRIIHTPEIRPFWDDSPY